jgi:hypothetical protein
VTRFFFEVVVDGEYEGSQQLGLSDQDQAVVLGKILEE